MKTIRVDMHVHSCFSRDSLTSLKQIVAACQRRGIDRIALTDHDTIRGALALRDLAPDLVIVGQEIRTTAGELIAFYVQEEVPAGLTPQEAIARLRDQGAIIGVSHPLDRIRREAMGRRQLLSIISQIDCLETFNARVTCARDNREAAKLAEDHKLPATAGSDAHSAGSIGQTYVEMPDFDGPESFLDSLRAGVVCGTLSSFAVHLSSTYAKLHRRLGFGDIP